MNTKLNSKIPDKFRDKWNKEYSLGLTEESTILDVLEIIYSKNYQENNGRNNTSE